MHRSARLIRTYRESRFHIDDYIQWLQLIKARGVEFKTLENFNLHLHASGQPIHFIKHDIHDDLRNTVRMARAEHAAGIATSYFMMHRDPVNQDFYDRPRTWQHLRAIRDMGHAVGMHVDGFTLVERHGDLAEGVRLAKEEFAAHGLEVKIANTHGNAALDAKFAFWPQNFYKELAGEIKCCDPFWRAQHARYSIAELGFELWADTSLWIPSHGYFVFPYFVSDNSSGINAGRTNVAEWDIVGKPFDLARPHRVATADLVSQGCCIYLIHPQQFRPRFKVGRWR
jgi:hypothetical protein